MRQAFWWGENFCTVKRQDQEDGIVVEGSPVNKGGKEEKKKKEEKS